MESHNTKRIIVKQVVVDRDTAGQRIDNYLLGQLSNVPKTRIYKAFRKGEFRVNKGRIKPSYKLKAGDIIRVPFGAESDRKALPSQNKFMPKHLANIEQAIIYEDDYVIVINKPSGIAVHGGSGINYGLIEALRMIRPSEQNLELAHRIDRDTSGCLLIAKKKSALRHLHAEFREGRVDKRYLALVAGKWDKEKTKVDLPLNRNVLSSGERIVRVDEAGQASITKFKIVDSFEDATLVEAKPITGRTHQIRVHCESQGHSIAMDDKYGDEDFSKEMKAKGLNGLFLHAKYISFTLPENENPIKVEAPIGTLLESVLRELANT